MDIEKVRELVELMTANELNELKIVDGDSSIVLRRGVGDKGAPQVVAMSPSVMPAGAAPVAAPAAAVPAETPPAAADDGLVEITAPMVGTFYATPSPTADAFVKVGDKVTPDTVVCIVEAMKVMNEVKAEVSGVIKEVLLESGSAVEFGQPLYKVDPAG